MKLSFSFFFLSSSSVASHSAPPFPCTFPHHSNWISLCIQISHQFISNQYLPVPLIVCCPCGLFHHNMYMSLPPLSIYAESPCSARPPSNIGGVMRKVDHEFALHFALLLKLCSIWSSLSNRFVRPWIAITRQLLLVEQWAEDRGAEQLQWLLLHVHTSHHLIRCITFRQSHSLVGWWLFVGGIQLNAAYFELLLNSIENRIALLKLTSNLSFATWLFIRPRIIVIQRYWMWV